MSNRNFRNDKRVHLALKYVTHYSRTLLIRKVPVFHRITGAMTFANQIPSTGLRRQRV